MRQPTTTGLSCRHIAGATRTRRTENHQVCARPENSGRRCGPGYPTCPLFEDRRVVPFADPDGLISPDMDPALL
jgi:hypothetical protein